MYWRGLFLCAAVVASAGAFQPVGVPLREQRCSLHSFLEASGGDTLGRRQALTSAIATLSFLLFPKKVEAEDRETIVVTGANSGIGYIASRILAQRGHTVVLACRTLEKAKDAAMRIQSESDVSGGNLIPAKCDLADLASVKTFVNELQVEKIDVLCLNAGLSLNADDKKVQRTKDGFELTVGTNHLGHFYLSHLLLPKVNKNSGRIVVTASGVHDPDSPGGGVGSTATLGDLLGFERDGPQFEMVDGEPYDGDKAYKDSKLCSVMFTKELQRRMLAGDETKNIVANSFSPGLITSTGFFRYQSPVFSKAFGFIVENIAKVAETPEWGGASLAYMTTRTTQGQYYLSPPGSSKYGEAAFGNQFTVSPTSKESQDDAKSKKLWELSEKLVGIKA